MGHGLRRYIKRTATPWLCILAVLACAGSRIISSYDANARVPPLLADRIFENEEIINFFAVFTREPVDALETQAIPDTEQGGYIFPINRIQRQQEADGSILLAGVIHVSGDASTKALPLLNRFYSNAGGFSRSGVRYRVKINFAPALATTKDAVAIDWLTRTELDSFNSSRQIENRINDERMVVGLTQLGSRHVKINPVYVPTHRA